MQSKKAISRSAYQHQNSRTELSDCIYPFFDLLKNFVLEKGDLRKRNLIESPFTMLHPEGIRGIFNQKENDEILSLTEKVLAA